MFEILGYRFLWEYWGVALLFAFCLEWWVGGLFCLFLFTWLVNCFELAFGVF